MVPSRRTAAFAAGLVAPASFDWSLMPRSAAQQGLVTGLTGLATMAAARATQHVLRSVVDAVAGADARQPRVRWRRKGPCLPWPVRRSSRCGAGTGSA